MAREEYEKETDLVEMLRSLRLFRIFLKKYSMKHELEFNITQEEESCKYKEIEVGSSDVDD